MAKDTILRTDGSLNQFLARVTSPAMIAEQCVAQHHQYVSAASAFIYNTKQTVWMAQPGIQFVTIFTYARPSLFSVIYHLANIFLFITFAGVGCSVALQRIWVCEME